MNRPTMLMWIAGAVILIGLLFWVFTNRDDATPLTGNEQSTSTPVGSESNGATGGQAAPGTGGTPTTGSGANSNSGQLESYANATHGFTINYPRELNAEPFGIFHKLNNNDWRVNATAQKRGTPVISVPVFRVDNEGTGKKNYPLFFAAEVRVGVSTDVAQCYAKDDGYTNQTVTDVTINGVTWKKFVFGDAAMQQYINGASYRTVRNNKCYVIEQIRTGSSYRDETLVGGYTDADLDAIYARTTPIVMSFKFTQ